MTTATWMRRFISEHPHYKKDSVISEKINYDLMNKIEKISSGVEACAELTGKLLSKAKSDLAETPRRSLEKQADN